MQTEASQTEVRCVVSIDDNAQLVTVSVPSGVMPSPAVTHQWHEIAGNLGYGIKIERPLRTRDEVKGALADAKKNRADASLARLMLKHGRMTDEARAWVAGEYPQ